MLKSTADVAPIAFLKIAQDQASIFDVVIRPNDEEVNVEGDNHMYNTDFFKYEPKKEPEMNTLQLI